MTEPADRSSEQGPFFSVYWDPHSGDMVEEKRHVPLLVAMDAFRRLTASHCAFVVKRVFIVSDDEDYVTLDWDNVMGFTFPTSKSHPALWAQLTVQYPATNGGIRGKDVPERWGYKREDRPGQRDKGNS
jgi:hypothetical protein